MGANAEVIKKLYDAFARGDVPAVLSGFDAQIEWREAENFYLADKNPYIGPQAVAEGVFQRIVGDVDNFAAVPEKTTDGGDTVIVEGRYKGVVKATRKPIDAQFVHVWRLKSSKVVQFQQYTDTAQWARAMES